MTWLLLAALLLACVVLILVCAEYERLLREVQAELRQQRAIATGLTRAWERVMEAPR